MAKTTKYVENSKMHVHPKTVRHNQHSPTPIALKSANADRAKVVDEYRLCRTVSTTFSNVIYQNI